MNRAEKTKRLMERMERQELKNEKKIFKKRLKTAKEQERKAKKDLPAKYEACLKAIDSAAIRSEKFLDFEVFSFEGKDRVSVFSTDKEREEEAYDSSMANLLVNRLKKDGYDAGILNCYSFGEGGPEVTRVYVRIFLKK